jgi:peptide/nickel transport system permease protein
MSSGTIPARLKRWIFFWTPLTWLVLELIMFPKDRPLSSGLANVMGGFVDKRIGSYPAWTLWASAIVLVVAGVRARRTQEEDSRVPRVLFAMAVVTSIWAWAQMGFTQLDLSGRESGYSWLFQSVLVVLAAVLVWVWAAEHPERTELAIWNTREIWRLYRASWQGILGLSILLFFAAMALLAPFLVSHAWLSPNAQVSQTGFAAPSLHPYLLWFGSDEQGLSVLAEFVWSARISLFVGLLATLITTVVGAGAGIFTGYYGSWIGEVGMRIVDVFLVLPWLPFAMVLAAAWGQNYAIIILVIAFTSWAGTARVVRAGVLSVKESPFVERARAIGSSNVHIMGKHILPNVMPLIFANAVLTVAIAVFAETTLSFLGLGDPLNFSWGTMLEHVFNAGATQVPSATAYLLAPGIAVVLLVLAFNLMGTSFDEVLDPKLRRREDSDEESRFTARGGTPAVAMGGAGVGGGGGIFTPGRQTDDAMPDFNKPAGGGSGRPEGGGWVGGHITDDEEGGEE